MRSAFDRRVVPEEILTLVRACQRAVPCHLSGGAALSGAHLAHRLSADIDVFCHDVEDVRTLVRELPAIAKATGLAISIVRDSASFVRCSVEGASRPVELDLVFEPLSDLEPPVACEDVVVESFADLRAAKLTCLLSRSEPRDLVDVLFLERSGFAVEQDLPLARRKDAGIDPGVLAWLLRTFPTRPLPVMLEPLDEAELRSFRDALAERLKRAARP